MVFDSYTEDGAEVKAGVLKLKHREFFGCDTDRKCNEDMMTPLIKDVSMQVLSKKSDIMEKEEVKVATKTCIITFLSDSGAQLNNIWKPVQASLPCSPFCIT